MIFTTRDKPVMRLWSVAVWLIIWQLLCVYIGHDILLVSPVRVVVRLSQLAAQPDFWQSVLFSFWRIAAGFLLAAVSGAFLAALAARFLRFEELLAPVVLLIKAAPIASFIILILIWVSSRNLSVLISFLIVAPIVYTNMLTGIKSADKKLLEMAEVFDMSFYRRVLFIYMPQTLPFFQPAITVGLGLCWKAGIAAEIIGIPTGSIGERIYTAKIYLAAPDLFAWTLTTILISIAFERLVLFLLRIAASCIERS